ncbi:MULTISPECIES: hypothetical protein [unclassified Gordonia (in: high G+C Gram-positive bacteria)]|uniref:hypothetical protein n=1 Tax=unclassified Gordonia (in: high G+C Gram-positive bacteria) TaxID=2657482 RepID=UPI001CF93BCC|nr:MULTISPECIES: hypothetical protein [unclassified Gordonia (in: high G+C Gram-positive bacteria)]MCT1353843.1 hypothetical protein [Gordonia sp. p3-SID1431]UCZ91271.1 hypothetical protein LEL84_06325 [Gordonia sp. WA4-43]
MTKLIGTAAAVALALLAATGCSTDEPTSTPPTTELASAPTTTSVHATTTSSAPSTTQQQPAAVSSVLTALTTLGYACNAETDMTICTKDSGEHWQIRESPQGDGDRAFVTAACEAGVNDDGRVITDGARVVIYAGNDEDLDALVTTLASVGLSGLEAIDYC